MSLLGAWGTRHSLRLCKGLQQLRLPSSKWLTTTASVNSSPQPLNPDEGFWDKNSRLNRPISPHLTIYKLPLTANLSITHRATGIILSTLTSGFAIGMLSLPNNFPYYYSILAASSVGTVALTSAKFLLAFPFMFHLCNGVRHLVWDMGKGFGLNDLNRFGYAVIGTSLFLSVLATAM